MERAMNRMVEDFWLGASDAFVPPVNVREDDGEVVATVELPGMKQDDIEVTVRQDGIRIAGERKEESETKEEDYYCLESSYGRFARYVDLPAEVDESKAEATFTDGILKIKMPKSEDSKTRAKKIAVKAG
jgi:HSP20 family protein